VSLHLPVWAEDVRPFEKPGKKNFQISLRDAKRVVNGLELAAAWDKTEIYYLLKDWIDQEEQTGLYSKSLE
jgi:hypothetical protein